jgi:hypothetical protein
MNAVRNAVILPAEYDSTHLGWLPMWTTDNADKLAERFFQLESAGECDLGDFIRVQYDLQMIAHRHEFEKFKSFMDRDSERDYYDAERMRREVCSNIDWQSGQKKSGEL